MEDPFIDNLIDSLDDDIKPKPSQGALTPATLVSNVSEFHAVQSHSGTTSDIPITIYNNTPPYKLCLRIADSLVSSLKVFNVSQGELITELLLRVTNRVPGQSYEDNLITTQTVYNPGTSEMFVYCHAPHEVHGFDCVPDGQEVRHLRITNEMFMQAVLSLREGPTLRVGNPTGQEES